MSNGVITINSEEEIVTCNKSGLKILRTKDLDIIKKQSKEFFSGNKKWIYDKIKSVGESKEPEIIVDAEIEIFDYDTEKEEKISVNLTILPLINEDNDGRTDQSENFLGTLLMFEDISSEKRMKSTMSRYMDPGIADQLLEDGSDIMGARNNCNFIVF